MYSPLAYAAERGDLAGVRECLHAGAALDAIDEFGYTALHWAAQNGSLEIVEDLLSAGAGLEARQRKGLTPLLTASQHGHGEVAACLLAAGADVHATDATGETALHFAAGRGDIDLAHRLLQHGAHPDARDQYGRTPLTLAAVAGCYPLIFALADRAADVELRGDTGRTALLTVVMEGHRYEQCDRQGRARPLARSDALRRLLERGADPNAADDYGWTPLMRAAHDGDEEIVRLLLEKGADLHAIDGQGLNASMWAARGRSLPILGDLLGRGAQIEAMDVQGRTLLMQQMREPNHDIVRMLLERGANPNAADARGATVAMIAAQQGQDEMLRLLAQYGMDIGASDSAGKTALDYARRNGLDSTVHTIETLLVASAPAAPPTRPVPDARAAGTRKSIDEPAASRSPGGTARFSAGAPRASEATTDDIHRPEPPRAGTILPPEREVDCGCDVRLHRPVLRDPTGWNYRITACPRCGAVTVTETLVDEPRPHDVQCVGNRVEAISRDLIRWLAAWPRLAWGVWQEDRQVYLPAALRCETPEELEAEERQRLAEQQGLTPAQRLRAVGYPMEPPPSALPDRLRTFAEMQAGLELSDQADDETLFEHAGHGGRSLPFAFEILKARPDFAPKVAGLLSSIDPARRQTGIALVQHGRLDAPEIVEAVTELLRQAPLHQAGQRWLYTLLDTLYYIGPAAAPARPLLREIAAKIGDSDYYLRKRVEEIRELIRPVRP